MANRGQKGNREKRKPKAETVKSAPVTSTFSSAEAKAKAGQKVAKEKSPGSHCTTCLSQARSGFRDGPTHDVALPEDGRPTHRAAALG